MTMTIWQPRRFFPFSYFFLSQNAVLGRKGFLKCSLLFFFFPCSSDLFLFFLFLVCFQFEEEEQEATFSMAARMVNLSNTGRGSVRNSVFGDSPTGDEGAFYRHARSHARKQKKKKK
jgi:hypothetical protein